MVSRKENATAWWRRLPNWFIWVAATVGFFLLLFFLVADLIDERAGRYIEQEMNERLDGYSVRIASADLHLSGLAVSLRDMTITQDAHPDPPVAYSPFSRRAYNGVPCCADTWSLIFFLTDRPTDRSLEPSPNAGRD